MLSYNQWRQTPTTEEAARRFWRRSLTKALARSFDSGGSENLADFDRRNLRDHPRLIQRTCHSSILEKNRKVVCFRLRSVMVRTHVFVTELVLGVIEEFAEDVRVLLLMCSAQFIDGAEVPARHHPAGQYVARVVRA